MRVRMPLQPSKTGDRLGIWGDSKVCFVYIQGDSSNIPPANLSCWNSGHTWPTELWFLSRMEAAGASRGFSKGKSGKKKKEIWAAVHNAGPGSPSWISEGLIILDWGKKWHWGVERVKGGSRQSVHQSFFGAFRHITAGTNGDQRLEWLTGVKLHGCHTKVKWRPWKLKVNLKLGVKLQKCLKKKLRPVRDYPNKKKEKKKWIQLRPSLIKHLKTRLCLIQIKTRQNALYPL